jgi:hypothetical protein
MNLLKTVALLGILSALLVTICSQVIGGTTGLMVGLGSTPMNASVTQNQIQTEYDGLVFQKGIAVFLSSISN